MTAFKPYPETPPTQGNRKKYEPILDQLKKLPEGWYVIAEFGVYKSAASVCQNLKKRFTEFNFKSGVSGGKGKVYAQYKGRTR